MASDNSLLEFTPYNNEPPTSNYATLDLRNGHPVLDFDAAADESAIFTGVLPRHYAGGGITVRLFWAASSATSGDVVWSAAIERLEDEGTDMDADSFVPTAPTAIATAPATSGALQYTDIAITSGALMDSLAAGEAFRLKVTRWGSLAQDTMTGDAELVAVEIRET